MDLQGLREKFEHWQSQATTQQERDREANALSQSLKGLAAIEQGNIQPQDSCAIAKHHLSWLREHGEEYRQRVEIPVLEQYISGLEA